MKNKKIKIIMTSLLCAGIVSAGSFAVMANTNANVGNGSNNPIIKSNLSSIFQKTNSESAIDFEMPDGEEIRKFIIDGNLPEGFALPAGVGEWYTSIFNGEHKDRGISFGIGIDGIKGHFSSEDISIADILGISEDELEAKLEESDGNIFKILEDSGKLGEYKAKLLDNCKARLDEQVASGKISQDKADEAMARLEEAVDNFSSDGIFKMPNFSIVSGGMKGMFGFSDVSLAGILGISEDELEAKLEEADGNIFKILEDTGKLEEYKAKLIDTYKTKLDEQVAAGEISQDKADEAMARLEEAIDNFSSDGIFKMPGGGHLRESKGFQKFEKSEMGTGEKRLKSEQTNNV